MKCLNRFVFSRSVCFLSVAWIYLWCGAFSGRAHADLIKLANGGELRGKIVRPSNVKLTLETIRLETLTGATVVVEKAQTRFVTLRPLSVEEYESRSRQIKDDWEGHWDLAEWCLRRGLGKQREIHLRRVIELSPEHEKAQMALGRVWHQGGYIDRDELMASQGYVKYKNKYITPQELEVIEKTTDELERERGWFQKVRLWHGWLNGGHEERRRLGALELKKIEDPNAAPAIIRFLAADEQVEVRTFAVMVLVKISGTKAVTGLVKLALFDQSPEVRASALQGIGRDHYEHAQGAFVKALKSEFNAVVCRAAMALGQIGDTRSIGPLVEALMTVHHYQVAVDVPLNQNYSFTTDGNFASNTSSLPPSIMAAVRTGQMLPPIIAPPTDPPPKKLVTVRVEHYNEEVLVALGKLTQQNFGYDKRTWHLWWAAEKNQGSKPAKAGK